MVSQNFKRPSCCRPMRATSHQGIFVLVGGQLLFRKKYHWIDYRTKILPFLPIYLEAKLRKYYSSAALFFLINQWNRSNLLPRAITMCTKASENDMKPRISAFCRSLRTYYCNSTAMCYIVQCLAICTCTKLQLWWTLILRSWYVTTLK